jgi:hypothetical protein
LSDLAFKGLLATTLAIAWTIEFLSTRFMSPNLHLVANPVIAKFGWRFALIGGPLFRSCRFTTIGLMRMIFVSRLHKRSAFLPRASQP